MATAKDRAHMRAIAKAMEELEREDIRQASQRPPGKNIELGLALSEFASAICPSFSKSGEEVPPIRLWREIKGRHGNKL